jgi:hypothetical protein
VISSGASRTHARRPATPHVYESAVPEDIPRSTPGRTPGPRDTSVPPSWWRELARTDLPTGAGAAAFAEIQAPDERSIAIAVTPGGRRGVHPAAAATLIMAFVIALALIVVGSDALQLLGVAIVALELMIARNIGTVAHRFRRR